MRAALVEALTWDDLKNGRGDPKQRASYEELEWRRCSRDPIYFVEHYGWLFDKESRNLSRFVLWPIQRQMLKEWQQGLSTVAVKARQLGVTTLSAHFALWEVIFKEAAKWVLLSSSEKKAKDIIDRVQATKDRLPQWMLDRATRKTGATKEGTRRKDRSDAMMRVSYGHSEMEVATSTARSIKGSAANFILDEFTEHEEQERKWHMLLPAIDGGSQAIIIANGEGEDTFYDIYQQAKSSDSDFIAHFFWWGDDPRRLDDATIDGKPALDFDKAAQLQAMAAGNLVAPWYTRMEKRYKLSHPEADSFAFKQQYPSTEDEAFYLTGNSRFSMELLHEMRMDLHKREIHARTGHLVSTGEKAWKFEKLAKGALRMYEEPIENAKYVIGVDSADGKADGDWSVSDVWRIEGDKLIQAAVFEAKARPDQLAYETERMGWYYNEALVVIEVNNHGQVVRDKLKGSYYNLYLRKRYEKFADDEVDNIGFWSDGSSKLRIIDQLDVWLNERRIVINDSRTLDELMRYEVKDNGISTGAPKGMYDDLVTTAALAVEGALDLINRTYYEPITIISYGRPS